MRHNLILYRVKLGTTNVLAPHAYLTMKNYIKLWCPEWLIRMCHITQSQSSNHTKYIIIEYAQYLFSRDLRSNHSSSTVIRTIANLWTQSDAYVVQSQLNSDRLTVKIQLNCDHDRRWNPAMIRPESESDQIVIDFRSRSDQTAAKFWPNFLPKFDWIVTAIVATIRPNLDRNLV